MSNNWGDVDLIGRDPDFARAYARARAQEHADALALGIAPAKATAPARRVPARRSPTPLLDDFLAAYRAAPNGHDPLTESIASLMRAAELGDRRAVEEMRVLRGMVDGPDGAEVVMQLVAATHRYAAMQQGAPASSERRGGRRGRAVEIVS